jgi:starvation-inducible outer membrane lipoprotein
METKKHAVILITLLLLTVSACASSPNVIKNVYSSHPGGRGHPWDKGRSY